MRRRDLFALIAAIAWPLTARAQESQRVIGVLRTHGSFPGAEAAFVEGLKDTGFIEGKNLRIDQRRAEGQYDRLPSLAGELVSRGVDVIASFDGPAAFAAKAATTTIPIVFLTGADPVNTGLVGSLNRPSGNLTGVSVLISSMEPKRLGLLHELIPTARTIALLVNPGNPNAQTYAPEADAAANAIGLHLEVLTATTEGDLEAALATAVQKRAGALVVMADPFFHAHRDQLVAFAARHAMPTIYPLRDFAKIGGLMSYGTTFFDLYQQAGTYTGKILKGAKPADLPIQQSTKFELVVNLKTATTLGLTVSPSLLAQADEVIE